ncbi:MAG TPA: hypothetical protein VIV58_02820 [Kofleriaceae bacterium]
MRFALDALKTGVPFGAAMGLFFAAQHGASRGLITGAAAGVAFGCAMAAVMKWQHARAATVIAPYEAEGILHHGPANHMAGTAIGGWLVMTKQRLVFEPHKLNHGGKRLELATADIAGARRGDGVLPNKIAVATRDGHTHQFVVRDRDKWFAVLPGVKAA